MASRNLVILLGHLGKDPETTYTPAGVAITKFSIATSEKYKDKEETQWHQIVTFNKLAEICGEYLKSGKQVYIEGKLQTLSWEDKEGVKRYTTEIIADKMIMLGGKNE
jgi:single-strand DNA-binding protein